MIAINRRLKKEDGFTMIEVIFAFVILAVGIIGVTGVFAYSGTYVRRAAAREAAKNLARSKLEYIKTLPFYRQWDSNEGDRDRDDFYWRYEGGVPQSNDNQLDLSQSSDEYVYGQPYIEDWDYEPVPGTGDGQEQPHEEKLIVTVQYQDVDYNDDISMASMAVATSGMDPGKWVPKEPNLELPEPQYDRPKNTGGDTLEMLRVNITVHFEEFQKVSDSEYVLSDVLVDPEVEVLPKIYYLDPDSVVEEDEDPVTIEIHGEGFSTEELPEVILRRAGEPDVDLTVTAPGGSPIPTKVNAQIYDTTGMHGYWDLWLINQPDEHACVLRDGFRIDRDAPMINSIYHAAPGDTGAPPGEVVTIDGNYFDERSVNDCVYFGSRKALAYPVWNETEVQVVVPGPVPPPGSGAGLWVKVYNDGQWSNSVAFTIEGTAGPVVTGLDHYDGEMGESLVIYGNNFGDMGGSDKVEIGTAQATIFWWGGQSAYGETIGVSIPDSQIAVVPVSVYKGVVESNEVGFTYHPIITQLDPDSGPVGHTIHIEGKCFGTAQAADHVEFTGINIYPGDPEMISWSETDITVEVPEGAVTGYVYVVNDGFRCSDPALFTKPGG